MSDDALVLQCCALVFAWCAFTQMVMGYPWLSFCSIIMSWFLTVVAQRQR